MIEIFDNIRKIYHFSPPCEELADYIEFFSESSTEATLAHIGRDHFTVKMFPSWTPTFWFNLGAPYHLTMGDQQYLIQPGEDVLIIRDSTVERFNQPADHIFSIKFFPGGLEAIFGIDQSKMKDQLIPLQQVLPVRLLQQLRQLHGFEDRMYHLQDYFLAQFHRKKQRDHYIRFVKDTMACYGAGGLQYNVNELSARLFTSSRTINRYFHQVVGIGPKHYFSIVRARTALTAYIAGRKTFSPTDFGYYDMSHFYKEMQQFTGRRLPAPKP
ncbi:AraC family transcriptional regulator [Chitinophaga agrisoli]|uniref:AraC family transcriptional regulator n=1 Tax=Chitinophaga agrisoli TaxID=2607653 RepID=A0A5B2VY43_9BACT|nr:helix-turn-helix domain-containing protein [Chitinophaga agrisoli]KAA2243167.1 AraC family transcriptional regulator [Chitinophaga agrisoli]